MNIEISNQGLWGACGTHGCEDCLPLFDSENNIVEGSDV